MRGVSPAASRHSLSLLVRSKGSPLTELYTRTLAWARLAVVRSAIRWRSWLATLSRAIMTSAAASSWANYYARSCPMDKTRA